jgi:diguanylate cyclase (GGDEF)-like protein/PAS domain S-box-containing protein
MSNPNESGDDVQHSDSTSTNVESQPHKRLELFTFETMETLAAWLGEHPDAIVGAVNNIGITVDMPDAIPLGPSHQNDERSLLELVIPEDFRAVTDAFVAALSRGVGVNRIHMASDPNQPLLLEYLDLQEEHGILLRMIVPADDLDGDTREMVQMSDLATTRPRLGAMTKSEVGTILSIDHATTLMLGWTEDDMAGHSSLEFIHPDDQVHAIDNWMGRLSSDHASSVQTVRLRYLCKNGSWLWLETSNDFQAKDDETTVVVTKLIDVSQEMAAVEALRRNERFLRQLTDTVPVGLFHISSGGGVAFVNPVLHALLGGRVVETLADLADALVPGDGTLLEDAINGVMGDGADADLDISLAEHVDGSQWSYRITLRAVTDAQQILGVFGCVVDVTELRTLADTDVLTGLRNRRWILDVLASELQEHAGRVSVIFIDLDHFKAINDQHGHHIGDELLVEVGDRLRKALRPTDRIGRIGGDEFLVVCPGLSGTLQALAVAQRLQSSLHSGFTLSEVSVEITACFGVACGYSDMKSDELVSRADTAMYECKKVRGGPPKSFEQVS